MIRNWCFSLSALLALLVNPAIWAQEAGSDRGAESDYQNEWLRTINLEAAYVNANLSFEKGNNIGVALRLLMSKERFGNQIGLYYLQYRSEAGGLTDGILRDDFSIGVVVQRHLLEDVRLNPLVEASLGYGRYVIPAVNLPAPPPGDPSGTVRRNYLDVGIGFGMTLWQKNDFNLNLIGRAIFNLGSDTGLNQVSVGLSFGIPF